MNTAFDSFESEKRNAENTANAGILRIFENSRSEQTRMRIRKTGEAAAS